MTSCIAAPLPFSAGFSGLNAWSPAFFLGLLSGFCFFVIRKVVQKYGWERPSVTGPSFNLIQVMLQVRKVIRGDKLQVMQFRTTFSGIAGLPIHDGVHNI